MCKRRQKCLKCPTVGNLTRVMIRKSDHERTVRFPNFEIVPVLHVSSVLMKKENFVPYFQEYQL